MNSQIPNLQKKLEIERSDIDAEIVVLENDLKADSFSDQRVKKLLEQTKLIFQDPIAIWHV